MAGTEQPVIFVELPFHPVFVGVVFVLNLTENLLDHILHTDDARRTAKLIDYQSKALAFR